MKFATKLI